MRSRRLGAVAGALGVAAMAAGCRGATEIRVTVTTDLACGEVSSAGVAVGEIGVALEGAPVSTSSSTCQGGRLGAVVLVPSGDDGEDVAFKVYAALAGQTLEGCIASGKERSCILARRKLRFVPNESLAVEVPMRRACEGTPCANDTTCVNGACQSATIPDPTACATQTCGEGALGGTGGADAGIEAGSAEGGSDATLADAGGDGTLGDAGGDGGGGDATTGEGGSVGAGVLSLGAKFTCAVRDGGAVCWGQDDIGQLGRGSGASSEPPAPVQTSSAGGALTGVRGMVSGSDDTCAFLVDGGVPCWGGGVFGPPSTAILYASPLPALAGAQGVAIGTDHACWVMPGGSGIECGTYTTFGNGSSAHDGDGGTGPSPDGLPTPALQIAASEKFTCVLTAAHEALCEGDNSANEIDPASAPGPLPPTRVPIPESPVLELGLRSDVSCAIAGSGHVWCSRSGQTFAQVMLVDGGALVAEHVAAGQDFTCARVSSSELDCWGANGAGQLGRGPVPGSEVASPVLDADGGVFTGASLVAAGGQHACAFKTDGSLWCWGSNANGELGDPDGGNQAFPRRVSW